MKKLVLALTLVLLLAAVPTFATEGHGTLAAMMTSSAAVAQTSPATARAIRRHMRHRRHRLHRRARRQARRVVRRTSS